MPPHHCCSSYTCESASSGGISLHCQSYSEYKVHMLMVWKLKKQKTVTAQAALVRGKSNATMTKGLGQTPDSQQHEAESRMQIDSDDIVSLQLFSGLQNVLIIA